MAGYNGFSKDTGKRRSRLAILSRDEIKLIIDSENNPKLRLMLILTYSAGLTAMETVNIQPADIDFNNKNIKIKGIFGKNDRIIPLSEKILDLLKPYIEIYRPVTWLFPGNDSVSKITEESFQTLFKESLKKAGITKEADVKSLRESFAAHLKGKGSGLKIIHDILGFDNREIDRIENDLRDKKLTDLINSLGK